VEEEEGEEGGSTSMSTRASARRAFAGAPFAGYPLAAS
jgi:hypothetical protein